MTTTHLKKQQFSSAIIVTIGVIISLVPLQLFMKKPILLAERFFSGAGWLQIGLMIFYGIFLAWILADKNNVAIWRVRIWSFFSVVFFAQLFIGLLGVDECLMSGKLHFPIPAMIVVGPVYRGEWSVMTLIFISTLVLTGPAWCSYFCYFGAMDGLASKGKTSRKPIKNKSKIRNTILILLIIVALGLRFLGISGWLPSLLIVIFAIGGFLIIGLYSFRIKKMVHCTVYCPVGAIVSHLKRVSLFRMSISQACNSCMKCTPSCKYDALNISDLRLKTTGMSCTFCGDCISSCNDNFITYRFFNMDGDKARLIFQSVVVVLHILFLNSARI